MYSNVDAARDYSEGSQKEKDKNRMLSLTWNLKYDTNETAR